MALSLQIVGSPWVAEISVFGGTQRYWTVLAETDSENVIPSKDVTPGCSSGFRAAL
jgi:hypothetical protein